MRNFLLAIFFILVSTIISFGQNIAELKQKAEQGDAKAQTLLGLCYSKGYGVSKDSKEAVKWYQKAAEQGNADAQNLLGVCYSEGDGIPKDSKEAVKWYQKAAEQGNASAQCLLGLCYSEGDGIPKDFKEAVKWWRKAAEQGYADAQLSLGLCYSKGEGVSKDSKEAVKWWRKAAEQGNANAQFNLGLCYEYGEGIIQNHINAFAWYALSAAIGKKDSINRMYSLKVNMTPDQIEQALNLAKDYTKGIFDKTSNEGHDTKTGSGFAITSNGYIITNYHVIADRSKITLVKNGLEYPAMVLTVDESNDIAILKISSNTVPLPLITSRKVKVGTSVYSMGFPNVQLQGFSPKFTNGLISSLTGLQDDPKHFQISVPIQPGNSGGALVDGKGNVVGIITAKLSQKAAISKTGTIAENVSYALKSSYVLILLESISNISENLEDENPSEISSEKIAEKLKDSTYFIIAE